MKKFLLVFALMYSFAFGQQIKINEIDKFTNHKIIETSFEKLTSVPIMAGMGIGKTIWVALLQKDNDQYLRLKWPTNEVLAIDDSAPIIFLDTSGKTYTFKSTEFTIAGPGEGTVGMFGSTLYGLNIYAIGDLSQLEGKSFKEVRIHTTTGYVDLKIGKKYQSQLANLYKIFKNSSEKAK